VPIIDYFEDLIKCSECDSGLAPLNSVIKAKSWKNWNNKIISKYIKHIQKWKEK